MYRYKLKITNRRKKSQYNIKSLGSKEQFYTIDDLKLYVTGVVENFDGTLGYIEPGHGTKGKMVFLSDDDDLYEMYVVHKRKPEVLLWCYGDVDKDSTALADGEVSVTRKRCGDQSERECPASKRTQSISNTLSAVESIITKLREKHGKGSFSVEKLNCWAHMINSGKWSSYDNPPNLPFFKEKKEHTSAHSSMNVSSQVNASGSVPAPSLSSSPGKRLNLRMQCIEQLSKWHVLLEAGAIDQAQFDQLKATILDDINNL